MAEIFRRGKLSLVTLNPDLIEEFAENLSDRNREEFRELYRTNPLKEFRRLEENDFCYMVICDKKPLALIGLNPEDDFTCTMWACFSKGMAQHWITFIRASPSLIQFVHSMYPNILVRVWKKNTGMHNWLTHLSFTPAGMDQETIDFVRCIPPPVNIYADESRPVQH